MWKTIWQIFLGLCKNETFLLRHLHIQLSHQAHLVVLYPSPRCIKLFKPPINVTVTLMFTIKILPEHRLNCINLHFANCKTQKAFCSKFQSLWYSWPQQCKETFHMCKIQIFILFLFHTYDTRGCLH